MRAISSPAQFRRRLRALIARTGLSDAGFAARAGIDRSTLSLLLDEAQQRLPRAATLAQIAAAHGSSTDWLLGLAELPRAAPEVMLSDLVSPNADDPADSELRRWHREAKGQTVRYVPATLPDAFKTDRVIAHEFRQLDGGPAEARAIMRERIAQARAGHSDIVACCPRQALEGLALGEGVWRGLPLRERRRQLAHIAELSGSLHPGYRWHLFDGRGFQASPYTVFGDRRAAIYLGAAYLVFTADAIIAALTRHFDGLLRQTIIPPTEVSAFAQQLLKDSR
jgi:transcriptional regulator with XRE-family HTH domain